MPSTCFVPGCKTGYCKNYKEDLSLFVPPKDSAHFNAWLRKIPRADKKLTRSDVVCELHFENHFIERDFVHKINGEEIRIPRDRVRLKKDAIPTLFPNLPHYLSSRTNQRKRPRERSVGDGSQSSRKRKKSDLGQPLGTAVSNDIFQECDFMEPDDVFNWLLSCKLLVNAERWGRTISKGKTSVTYTTCNGNDQPSSSVIQCVWKKEENQPSVYVNHIKVNSRVLLENYKHDRDGIVQFLYKLCELNCCSGFLPDGNEPRKLSHNSMQKVIITAGSWHSRNCVGFCENVCLFCKQMKWNVSRQAQRERISSNLKSKRLNTNANARRHLKRAFQQQKNAEEIIKRLIKENESKEKNILDEAILKLPDKQQQAVLHCFKSSKMKTGRYALEWVVECILMRIKSSSLYNHIRDNKILALPCQRTLNNYIRGIDAECGISVGILKCFQTKLSHLDADAAERHGVLIFDELSLRPHLDLNKSKGKVIGLVDLGKHTTVENGYLQADHGLVLYFRPLMGTWGQAVGFYATRNAAPGKILTELLIDAVIKLEGSGVFVDAVICDGASSNRQMWSTFGIGENMDGEVKYKTSHPCDSTRTLRFISDVPHLFKCLRNRLQTSGKFQTEDGEILWQHIRELVKVDSVSGTAGLRIAPRLTEKHVNLNNFQKMSVPLMTQASLHFIANNKLLHLII